MGAKLHSAVERSKSFDYFEVLREVLNTFPAPPEQLVVLLLNRDNFYFVCPIIPGKTRIFGAFPPQVSVTLNSRGEAHAVLGRKHATPLRDQEFTILGDFEVAVFRKLWTAVLSLVARLPE